MSIKLFIFVALIVANISAEINSDVFLNEVRSLSQLPMDKLIGLRSAFSDQQGKVPQTSSFLFFFLISFGELMLVSHFHR